jgi:hypothetical protein
MKLGDPAMARKVQGRVFLLLIVAVSTVSLTEAQTPIVPSGMGTETDPYQIRELGHLVWMGTTVSSSHRKFYALMNDIDSSDTTNWNGGVGFNPIGTNSSETFLGTFNGGNHAIFGIQTVSQPSSEEVMIGWSSVDGRLYTVNRSIDLLATNAGFVNIATDLPSTPPWNVYTDVVQTEESRFYKIGVR